LIALLKLCTLVNNVLHDHYAQHHLSFPTRRSSDLSRPCRCKDSFQGGRRKRSVPHRSPSAGSSGTACAGTCCSPSRSGSSASARDRKSTRLNSSHVAISYDVFCLKLIIGRIICLSI